MMIVDCEKLTTLIDKAYTLGRDGRLSIDSREQFLGKADLLRDQLAQLLAAKFEDDTAKVVNANQMIKDVNNTLEGVKQNLDKAADALAALSALVKLLDEILKLL